MNFDDRDNENLINLLESSSKYYMLMLDEYHVEDTIPKRIENDIKIFT